MDRINQPPRFTASKVHWQCADVLLYCWRTYPVGSTARVPQVEPTDPSLLASALRTLGLILFDQSLRQSGVDGFTVGDLLHQCSESRLQ